MGSHSFVQDIFLTLGSNPGLLHCRQILYHLSHQGSLIGPRTHCKTSSLKRAWNVKQIHMLIFKHLLGEVRRVGALSGDWSATDAILLSPTLLAQAGMQIGGIPLSW